MTVRLQITVVPPERVDDFEIEVTDPNNRVSWSEVGSRVPIAGWIHLDIRGVKATPKGSPEGDTSIDVKLDGKVCGSVKVIVIVPASICGPCNGDEPQSSPRLNASSSSASECPEGSQRTAQNHVADATTSPAYVGSLGPNQVKLWTLWTQFMKIQVCDQFGDPLDSMYSGCCVEEFTGVPQSKWFSINQPINDDGTYWDPVGWIEQPSSPIVDYDSQAAQDWPTEPTLPMGSDGQELQDIPIRICGHKVGNVTRVVHRKRPNCVWIACPDGTIIVD